MSKLSQVQLMHILNLLISNNDWLKKQIEKNPDSTTYKDKLKCGISSQEVIALLYSESFQQKNGTSKDIEALGVN